MTRRLSCLLLALLLTTACETSTSGHPTAVPYPTSPTSTYAHQPRPRDFDLTGRNPCRSIPEDEFARLNISSTSRPGSYDKYPTRKAKSCSWDIGEEGSVFVEYVAGDGVDVFYHEKFTFNIIPYDPVLGFPAYTFDTEVLEGNSTIVIDVHAGQFLEVQATYDWNLSTDQFPLIRQIAPVVMTNLLDE